MLRTIHVHDRIFAADETLAGAKGLFAATAHASAPGALKRGEVHLPLAVGARLQHEKHGAAAASRRGARAAAAAARPIIACPRARQR